DHEKKDETRNAGYRPLHGRVETGGSIADAIVARTREPRPAGGTKEPMHAVRSTVSATDIGGADNPRCRPYFVETVLDEHNRCCTAPVAAGVRVWRLTSR